jgi:hypothetical protein
MMRLSEYDPKYANVHDLPGRRRDSFPEIVDEQFWQLYDRASPYSLVHVTGFYKV